MKRHVLIVLICSISFAYSNAQNKLENDIDNFIKGVLGEIPELPGLVISVVQNDQPVFVKGYGFADREKNIKATPTTPFYIASTTKSFMGMLSVVLEEEGKLKLDVPLTTYKPFKNLSNREVFEKITINDLLNHTSGIDNGMLTYRDAYTGDKPLDVKIMLLEETTLVKSEGKIFEYDNLGYNILDVLLEVELGLNWRDLLDNKIFTPLRMNRTSAYISEASDNNWGLAWPYMIDRTGKASRVSLMKDNSMMQAAGGLITTAEDAANWILFNLNSGEIGKKQIYPSGWVERTHKQISENKRQGQIFTDKGYGLGWFTANFKQEDIVYHFGGYPGFFSHISFMPKKNVGIAVFANEGHIGDNVSNLIATYIYDYFLDQVPVDGYEDQIKGIRNTIGRIEKALQGDYDNRNGREWQLDLPMSSYEGEFFNKHMGTIKVKIQDDNPSITLGRLNCIATPFSAGQMNVMRVALIPGRGQSLRFKIEEEKIIEAIYQGQVFTKVR